MKQKLFKQFNQKDWNEILKGFNEHHYLHTYESIEHIQKTFPNLINISQIIYDDENKPFAVLQLFITRDKKKKINKISINEAGCIKPIIKDSLDQSLNKKNLKKLNKIILEIAYLNNIREIHFIQKPIYSKNKKNFLSAINLFDYLNLDYQCIVHNSMIVDLRITKKKIFDNFSKSRKKSIKKNIQQQQEVLILNNLSQPDELDFYFEKFKKLHKNLAKRKNYNNDFYKCIYFFIKNNSGILFVSLVKKTPISFLFCRFDGDLAAGSIAANFDQYEKKFFPRHNLEWTAIKYFKKKKVKFYELGIRFNQNHVKNDTKLLTISEFKDRYGGMYFPEVHYFKKL